MLRHVQEQHSGFSYKCNICHKVLSRAQVHGTCPGRYRDTKLFHRETGARGWLAKQLFQQYKDNKLPQQWEELFKAPPPPPRPISPLPRTPPSTPPPTGRNCIVMTAIGSGRKRKAPTPEVQPKKKPSFTLEEQEQEWADIQLFDPNEEQFGEEFASRTKNVWFPPPTKTLTSSSSSSSSSESEKEQAKAVKSRVVVLKSSDAKKPKVAVKTTNKCTQPNKIKEQTPKTSKTAEDQVNLSNGKGKTNKTSKSSETKKIETKTQNPQTSANPKVAEKQETKKNLQSSKNSKDSEKQGNVNSYKEKSNPVANSHDNKKTEAKIQKLPASKEAKPENTSRGKRNKVSEPNEHETIIQNPKSSEKSKGTTDVTSISEAQTQSPKNDPTQDETATAVANLQVCLDMETRIDNHSGDERTESTNNPIMSNGEESVFRQLVNDAINSEHTEDTILNNPDSGTTLNDKINHFYTTFDFLQRIQESKVILNIGGQLFVTSELTLRVVPNSLFGLMFAEGCPLRPSNRMFRFDRDPSHFRIIPMYLRNGAQLDIELLPYERRYLLELLTEARFYSLEGLVSLIRERLRRTTGCDKY